MSLFAAFPSTSEPMPETLGTGEDRYEVLASNAYGASLRTPHGFTTWYGRAELRHLIATLARFRTENRGKRKGATS